MKNMTKTQLRNALKYFGMTRRQYQTALSIKGATLEDGIWWPLDKWLAAQMTPEEFAQAERRMVINNKITNVWSLPEYLQFLNKDKKVLQLTEDLGHWAEMNITTAEQLADYLDASCARNVEKSQYG